MTHKDTINHLQSTYHPFLSLSNEKQEKKRECWFPPNNAPLNINHQVPREDFFAICDCELDGDLRLRLRRRIGHHSHAGG